MPTATHKRGDTFHRSGIIDVTDYGTAVTDMTGWTGRSQIRDSFDNLVADLTFTWLNAATRSFELYAAAATTSAWQLGKHRSDIQLTTPAGDVVSTATQYIEVVGDVTHD